MPRYVRWDVIAVPFVYTEGDQSKTRPALIVSANDLADANAVYWVAMITTAAHGRWAGDVTIDDHESTGLRVPCIVRSAKLATVQESLIIRRIGSVSAKTRNAVHAVLRRYLP